MTFWRHKLQATFTPRRVMTTAVLLGVALCSCAGTHSGARSAPTEDDAFARIQVHEAEQLAAERSGGAQGAGCPTRCRAASSGCGASESICDIAAELADADALTRCERARARCESASTSTADCRCPSSEQGQ